MKNIVIFASGAGTNAEKIIEHFKSSTEIAVVAIVCNKPGAGVLEIAQKSNIATLLIEKEQFFRGNGYVDELRELDPSLLVLAGFLWKIPPALVAAFRGKIINIHPALLPGYGGKGMYGHHVHTAVIANRDKESGITIHYVDEVYDHGDIIFQARVSISEKDKAEDLAKKIHRLEHEHYPLVIEELLGRATRD